MSRFLVIAAVAIALVALSVPPASAGSVTFVAPNEHGVVDFGDRVTYDLRGACEAAVVRIVVAVEGGTVSGDPARGCFGRVTVPPLSRMHDRGTSRERRRR